MTVLHTLPRINESAVNHPPRNQWIKSSCLIFCLVLENSSSDLPQAIWSVCLSTLTGPQRAVSWPVTAVSLVSCYKISTHLLGNNITDNDDNDNSNNKDNNKHILQIMHLLTHQLQGGVSIRKTVLPGMAIPMLKIRRPNDRLIFNMENAIRR